MLPGNIFLSWAIRASVSRGHELSLLVQGCFSFGCVTEIITWWAWWLPSQMRPCKGDPALGKEWPQHPRGTHGFPGATSSVM